MPSFFPSAKRVLSLGGAALLAVAAVADSTAFTDGTRSSLDSPALVSEIPAGKVAIVESDDVDKAGKPIVVKDTVPLEPRPGFRALPYLQKPAADQMTINWFSEQGNDATLVVRGPGLPAEGKRFTVAGKKNPITEHQGYELRQRRVQVHADRRRSDRGQRLRLRRRPRRLQARGQLLDAARPRQRPHRTPLRHRDGRLRDRTPRSRPPP